MTEIALRVAGPGDLDALALHRLLRLRVEVFVVEQKCAYQDLDGRDLDGDTLHLWAEEGANVLGYLRMLAEPAGCWRVGRVCVAAGARGRGLADRLLRRAIERSDGRPLELNAQPPLIPWYERFGFNRAGERFVEDGIPQVPMRR